MSNRELLLRSGCARVLPAAGLLNVDSLYLQHTPKRPSPCPLVPACSKNLKHLLARKDLPDMGRMADVAEFLTRSGYGSVSSVPEGGGGQSWQRPWLHACADAAGL